MDKSLSGILQLYINNYGIDHVRKCVLYVCEKRLSDMKRDITKEMEEAKKIKRHIEAINYDNSDNPGA